jgi:hypothetical protein
MSDSFMCDKVEVLEIIEYQHTRPHGSDGFDGEYQKILDYTNTQENTFGYETYMSRVEIFVSQKLAASAGKFARPFKLRMRKYKRGQDWKIL